MCRIVWPPPPSVDHELGAGCKLASLIMLTREGIVARLDAKLAMPPS